MTTERQTVKQFKAWIEGVEEMQKADWHPTKEQWKKIRSKIDSLVEEPVTTSAFSTTPYAPPASAGTPMKAPATMSALESVEVVDTGVNEHTPVPRAPTPPVAAPSGVNALTTETTDAEGKTVLKSKTPNIDTSAGDYKSPFAG